jgi:hypothetical protein
MEPKDDERRRDEPFVMETSKVKDWHCVRCKSRLKIKFLARFFFIFSRFLYCECLIDLYRHYWSEKGALLFDSEFLRRISK